MTPQKLTGFHKFVCFVLIAILIILVIGFVANGWDANGNIPGSGDVGNSTDDTDNSNDNNGTNNNDTQNTPPAEDKESSDNNPQDAEENVPEDEPIIYINSMTGLEISEETYNRIPYAILMNPSSPLYGVSSSDIAIEFPIEDGTTRLLLYDSSDETLWKIGALAPTRKFISRVCDFFGGIIISHGEDDKISYDIHEGNSFTVDISKYGDCHYVENGQHIYTTENMIEIAKNKTANYQPIYQYKTAPYEFYENSSFIGTNSATTIIIPYSTKNETELYYHEKTGEYLYYKSSNRKMDMLTGKNVSYKNIFILFADATTYEKSEGSELIIDVVSGGKGYYASEGKYTEFTWKTDVSGELSFYTLSGEKLKVNPGKSYFTYYKSSCISMINLI